MPRRPRVDFVGAWKHITNRGLAKRTVFETRMDVRYFLSCVARAVRAGLIEIHAYCVLPTHFHLLVRSPLGRLDEAMRRMENRYVRWFNRRRRRDGPIFRGRYYGGLIESDAHWQATVWYIDHNPVKAGLCSDSAQYPYCSTYFHRRTGRPPWLAGGAVSRLIRGTLENPAMGAACPALEYLVNSRLGGTSASSTDLDSLISASPARVRDWMIRKSFLADGTRPGAAIVHPDTIRDLLDIRRAAQPERRIVGERQKLPLWPPLEAGLLRTVAALGYPEIAARLGIGVSTAHDRVNRHKAHLRDCPEYADEAGRIAREAIATDFGWLSDATAWAEICSPGS